MFKQTLLMTVLATSAGLSAHDDITRHYLVNGDFDEKFNYDATHTTNVAGDIINDVYGWTYASEATYTVAGTFEWNGKAKFNSGTAIPAAGYDGSAGGGLALSSGWGQVLTYTQNATLTKGTYRLATAAYNTGTGKGGTLTVSWTPNGGTATTVQLSDFTSKTWKADTLEFTLTAKKAGTISVSFAAAEGVASSSSAKLIVDYVRLLAVDMDLTAPLSSLKTAISSANTQYGDGTNTNAEVLKEVIDRAQAIYEDPSHTAVQILDITAELKQATLDNKLDNATAAKPYNMTTLHLTNPSFEDGFTGWVNQGMSTQTNAYFTKKSGNTYAEAWTSVGGTVGDRSVTQTVSDIPAGRYRLTAAALNIQQSSGNSTTNNGDDQTGAYVFADAYSTPVCSMKDYSIEFVVLGNEATIGFRCEGATGNWVCIDNFRLQYIGRVSLDDQIEMVQQYIANIQDDILPKHMQDTAREAMDEALTQAQAAVANPEAESINQAIALLESCMADCQASIALYDALKERIDHAYIVLDWIKENESKVVKLQKAINTAEEKWNNFTLTNAVLKSAVTAINNAITTNDRQHYKCGWSMGDTSDPNNAWYEGRTTETKNWVLYWEKGHGEDMPDAARAAVEHAQTAFDFYTDSLKYINRATSKTNTYKMIIKLRYSTDWEATGSGVDNQIGLLTLTPWAQSSRNWQTLYHEVGHCFQYQTHCDNNDWNGWMYTVGPKGTAFWEQCAQWQAYKIMPYDQFTNEWFGGYMANVHKHILHEAPRYNNYFVMDYWCMKHGMDFMGRLWNESRDPEDACEAYQRITGISNSQFNDEMWECAARFATWDIPHLAPYQNDTWKNRPQPEFSKDSEGYWVISANNAPENTGHNIIKLNAPSKATTVSAEFEGLAGDSRYRKNYVKQAGWRYGFVALLKDGTRVYGPMGSASADTPQDVVTFDCPANCANLWLIVSGAAKTYVAHGWDDDDSNDEQWGYRVRFDSTNLQGNANDHITGIEDVAAEQQAEGVFTITGIRLRQDNNTAGLPAGIYIVGGRKVSIR